MKIHQDRERQSALGMFRYSLDFYESALAIERTFPNKKLIGQDAQTAPFTAYYLLGHAIELALKAALLQHDDNCHEMLRNTIGHNLELCLEKVREVNSSILDFVDENQKYHVLVLNDNYCIKRFEYAMTGAILLSDWPTLTKFTSSLQRRVAQLVPHGRKSMSVEDGLRY